MRFVDTNVLLYAIDTPADDNLKRGIARRLLYNEDLVTSVQVVHEFYHQAIRPTRPNRYTRAQALSSIDSLKDFAYRT